MKSNVKYLNLLSEGNRQRGAVLLLFAFAITILMGMAAFAVDLGWISYNRLEARKAAEAAALAGVVHMPLPGSTTFAAGAAPYDTAIDLAARNGYVNGVGGVTVTPATTASPSQIKVTITDQIDTFFLKLFVPGPFTITGEAVAEQLPPLKIGSDDSYLGGPALPATQRMWVAINGERRKKTSGDPYSTRCDLSSRCSGTPNSEFRDPAYYYAVEVPDGQSGSLDVQIWDGTHRDRGNINLDTGEYNYYRDTWSLRFDLYAPDSTPNTWTDNSTLVCTETFYRDGQGGRPVGWGINEWRSLGGCGSATSGIYVLAVSVDGGDSSVSAFAIQASVGGTSNVSVYGLGSMSLWMNQDYSNPTFKIVRLDTLYAGTELEIGLFDPGDATGLARMKFTGALTGYDCLMQVTDEVGNVSAWQTDSWWNSYKGDSNPNWAGSSCGITTSRSGGSRLYNGDWIKLRFQLPPEYSCTGNACWALVDYNFDNSPFDRTTWTARVNGTPVHLIP